MNEQTVSYIQQKLQLNAPDTAVILGSGLSGFAEKLTKVTSVNYKDIPNFPQSTVVGHKGQLLRGFLGNKELLCLNGRFHLYEGH